MNLPDLFIEYNPKATLSLEDNDSNGSVRKLFLETMDPTGVAFADAHLPGGYPTLAALRRTKWFKPHFERWSTETRERIKAQAIKVIRYIAMDEDNKGALAAAKYLASIEYESSPSRGRPTREEVDGKLKADTQTYHELQEDLKRLNS